MLLTPPIALLIYIALISILVGFGRWLAGSSTQSTNSKLYASGETAPHDEDKSVPGYRPFFVVSLFFAVLHLGVVVLATSGFTAISILYLIGLMMVLIALILG